MHASTGNQVSGGGLSWPGKAGYHNRTLTIPAIVTASLLTFGAGRQFAAVADKTSLSITPINYDFGTHDIGTNAKTSFILQNQGTAKLEIGSVSISGSSGDFFIDNNDCRDRLAVGKSCTVIVSFCPTAEDSVDQKNGPQLVISYSAAGVSATASARLSGSGYVPDLTISPHQAQFGSQPVATHSSAQIVTVTNTRSATGIRKISTVSASGDFSLESHSCSEPLKPGDSCLIIVSFSPQRAGESHGVLRVGSDSNRGPREIALLGAGEDRWSRFRYGGRFRQLLGVGIACFLYWLGMLLVRWNRIAKGTRRLLLAQVDSSIVHCLALEKLGAPQEIRTELLVPTRERIKKHSSRLGDFLFWSRGQEIAGWGRVHEAEIKMAEFLPPSELQVRLEILQAQLAASDDSCALALSRTIQQAIGGTIPADPSRLKALLAEALNKYYDKTDSSFADLLSWQNKTGWIVSCGLLLVIALVAVLNHAELFLLGATGGLLSRLSRSLRRKDVPTDYGASWTTLFLSPVAGALGGWAGVLLASLASEINVLGSAVQVEWQENSGVVILGLAFLFGFSERAFDAVLSKIENTPVGTTGQQPSAKTVLQITTASELTSATVGQDYRVELKASGGTGALVWTKTSGELPGGLQFDPNGVITGKAEPAAAGQMFAFTTEVKDSSSKQSQRFTIKVA